MVLGISFFISFCLHSGAYPGQVNPGGSLSQLHIFAEFKGNVKHVTGQLHRHVYHWNA